MRFDSQTFALRSLDLPAVADSDGAPLTPDELWLGKPVPRYTSYPPATLFKDDIVGAHYVEALSALEGTEPLSLYLHVPFCRALCLYCGCNTCATSNDMRLKDYLAATAQEADRVSALIGRKRPLSRLHFGGGSPNMLSERAMDGLFLALDKHFCLSSASEIAMELDPRLVTIGQAALLSACGVTRVSLGVQDFNPAVQKAIGRVQSFALVERAVETLREYGIKHISLDLIYGLPLQTPAGIADTAQLALTLKPDRVALFSYAHVPQAKRHQKALEAFGLPDSYGALAMEQAARAVFREGGYEEIGMDHFAKASDSLVEARDEGRLRRNFQGYTDDSAKALLGLGASAIGSTGSAFFQNERDARAYQDTIWRGRFATVRGLKLTGEDKVRAAIIEELMCTFSCNIETKCREHNYALAALAPEMEALEVFEKAGLVAREGYRIRLTSPHRMAIRVIANVFDSATRAQNIVTSRAV